MTNPQEYAVRIEHGMRNAFECERGGMGGLVNSDFVRQYPFAAMMCTVTYLYGRGKISEPDATKFFENYSYCKQYNIDKLLAFDSKDGCLIDEGDSGGKEAIESMIESFSALCTGEDRD